MYKIFLLCLVVLFGCSKNTPVSEKKETSSKSYESSPDVTVSYVSPEGAYEPIFEYEYNYEPLPEEEIERLTLILHEQEKRYLEGRNTEILSIYKVNFGIPDGDNYLVLWTSVSKRTDGSISSTSKDIYLYSISDKIEFSYFTRPGFPITEYTNFDIMENIPGIHIGTDNGTSIFDCNGDGIDELFFYG